MNIDQIEIAFNRIIDQGGINRSVHKVKNVYSLSGGLFTQVFNQTKLLKGFKHNFDSEWLTVDFLKKTITLHGDFESYHNGDSYGEETLNIPWSELHKLIEPTIYYLVKIEKDIEVRAAAKEAAIKEKQAKEAEYKRLKEKALRGLNG